ncbi:MAG: cysteine desulfurase family protein [Thermomicrobiales bacterium]
MFDNDDTIYLDAAATTPLDPDVLAAMMPYLTGSFGNPSSIYQLGQETKAAIEDARGAVARVIGARPAEIVFTSGATESDNTALAGVLWSARFRSPNGPAPHLITSAVEHHAVLHCAEFLEKQGFAVTALPVDREGFVDPATVEAAIRPETALISIMYANNEVGAIQPITEIGRIAREHGVPFHTDAVQAAGALAIDVHALNVDLLSLSAHKFGGPKGVGCLYVRKGVAIEWMQLGGGQEGGRRGGTENVAGIVGFGTAIQRAERERSARSVYLRTLRDELHVKIVAAIPEARLNGPADGDRRLPNNLNIAIPGVQGETMLLALDMMGISASAGSACTTGNSAPSHVLLAMGLSEELARSSLRFSVGPGITSDDLDDVVSALTEIVERTRSIGTAR